MAATPAPHVPVSFLLKGAGALFSDACKAALMQAGYDPEWFGSFDHVRSKIDEAGAAVRAGTATPAQRFLAGSQSGHLVPNSTWQGGRNNPCQNVGNPPLMYDCNLAPCMPHFGAANHYGTEHYLVTRMEADAAAMATTNPGGNTPTLIEGQATQRMAVVTDTQQFQQQSTNRLNSLNGEVEAGKLQQGAVRTQDAVQAQQASAAHLAQARGAQAGALTPEEQAAAGTVTGNNAVECIESFRKAYMVAMQQALGQAFGVNGAGTTGSGPGGGAAGQSSAGTGPTREQLIHGRDAPARRACLEQNAAAQNASGQPFNPVPTPQGRVPGGASAGGGTGTNTGGLGADQL